MYPSPGFMAALPKYANLIVDYSIGVKEDMEVLISAELTAAPLVREVYREVLRRNAYPTPLYRDDLLSEIFYLEANEKQLEHVTPVLETVYEKYDASISILSSIHTKPLIGIDPKKMATARRAIAPLFQKFLEQAARGERKWTVAPYPTLALAQEASMRPLEFEEFVYRAVKLHTPDPVKAWKEQAEKQERVISEILSRAGELKFEGPGIDLTVNVAGRTWISDDGHENMPGGEVFTGPHEDGVDGCVEFDMPQVYSGVEVEGVKLCFKNGVLVEYTASKGRDFLEKMVNLDEGAKRLGELAFGLNYDVDRQTKEILFDEKIGGTIHMALGNGYPETGSVNRSALHWDMIKSMWKGRVYADGDLVYENGYFINWNQ